MTVYLDLVMGLNFLIDFFLLLGTNRICGSPTHYGRAAAAAALGGVYGGICLLPKTAFLGNMLWRMVSLGLMAVIAYGWQKATLRKGMLFTLLTMALGGIAQGLNMNGIGGVMVALAALAGLCVVGFSGRLRGGDRVSVMLKKGEKVLHLTALRDTGNTLIDPITGTNVLVVGSEVAWELLHLSETQLQTPVETMASANVPGLRLIPYRAVGCSSGMLLAAKLDEVRIGGERSGNLVAFAPQEIGSGETYQALAGGVL